MLNEEESRFVYEHAFLPEHLPDYVQSIPGEEPFLHVSHLCLYRAGVLTFIGYPLEGESGESAKAYASA
jgi:hypothetical protein